MSGTARSDTEWWVFKAVCTRVVDGDTVDLLVDLGFHARVTVRVRLDGIDTPEMHDSDPDQRALAVNARSWLERRLSGAQLRVETAKADGFGRWLARVHVDGVSINEQMLQLGLAKPYKRA